MTRSLASFLLSCLFFGGIAVGVVIQRVIDEDNIVKAEAGCHAWCDKNNPDEIANMLCKSQCTGIIVESRCLKFPNE